MFIIKNVYIGKKILDWIFIKNNFINIYITPIYYYNYNNNL